MIHIQELHDMAIEKFDNDDGYESELINLIEKAIDFAYNETYSDDDDKFNEVAINELKRLTINSNYITQAEITWLDMLIS